MDERILQRVASTGPLQGLTAVELEQHLLPTTTDPRPSRVTAWVRFGDAPIKVDAEAVMWTPKAVAIRFHVGDRECRTWVWASAVDQTAPVQTSAGD